MIVPKTAGISTPVMSSRIVSDRLAFWNRRLLVAASVLVLWGATVLALQAAGPNARAMIAGEGMLITGAEQDAALRP